MCTLSDAPRERIGPYRIVSVLGSGGMGIVYRAIHQGTGQTIALKATQVDDPDHLAGMRAEIQALRRLRHPGVVNIVDEGIDERGPWYAMDLIEGQTLREIIKRAWAPPNGRNAVSVEPSQSSTGVVVDTAWPNPPFARSDNGLRRAASGDLIGALRLVRRLCEPLAHIHGRGHVHGDLSPRNIIIQSNGEPVLVDFGLAARHAGTTGREHIVASSQIRGTVAYLAPERIRGLPCDPRSDLYALGCVLYELLTGCAPFRGDTAADVLSCHLGQRALPPSMRVSGIDDALDDLVLGLLEKDPRDRIGYAEDVAIQLGRWLDEGKEPLRQVPYLYQPGFVGRDELVNKITQEVSIAAAGQGRMLVVGGESGIGKTSLASSVGRIGRDLKMRVISCECTPMGVGESSVDELVGAPLQPLKPLLVAIADACRTRGREAFDRVLGTRARLLAPYEPAIAQLPQVAESPIPTAMTPEAAQHRLITALHESVVATVDMQPLLLIVDDLQWADELTLAFLSTLDKRGLEHQPILVLGTYRTEEMTPSLAALITRPFVKIITLDRLNKAAIASMAQDMLAMQEPPKSLTNWLDRQSEGNPFYVAEYIRLAVAESILVRRESRWCLANAQFDSTNLPLPDTLRGVLERRLSSLTQQQLFWMRASSVIGREIDLALLSALGGHTPDVTLAGISDLCVRQLLEVTPHGARRFAHDKLREVVYANTPRELRRELHAQCGMVLEARLIKGQETAQFPILAHHFYEAEDYAKASHYHVKCGELALAVSSGREAARYLESALASSRKLTEATISATQRFRWARQLAEASILAGDRVSADKHLREGLAIAGVPPTDSLARWSLRLFLEIMVRLVLALRSPRAAVTGAPVESREEELQLFHLASEHFIYKNALVATFWALLKTINVAESLPPTRPQARGLALAALALDAAPLLRRTTERWAKRAMQIAESIGDPVTSSYVLSRVGIMSIHRGRMDEAEELLSRSISLANVVGDRRCAEEAMSITAMLQRYVGRFRDAMATWSKVRSRATLRDDKQVVGWAMLAEAEDALRVGQSEYALSTIEAASEWLASDALGTERIWGKAVRALVLSRSQRNAEALSLACDLVVELKRAPPFVYFLQPALGALAETLLDMWSACDSPYAPAHQKLREAARGSVDVLMGFAARFPFAMSNALHQRGRYHLLCGRVKQAQLDFERAQEIARKLGLVYDEGRCALERARSAETATQGSLLRTAIRCLAQTSASRELAEAQHLRARTRAIV